MKEPTQTAAAMPEFVDNDNRVPPVLRLDLELADPRSVALLCAVPEGRARSAHARTALDIGLLALEQARGQIDVDAVRREGQRILEVLDEKLRSSAREMHMRVSDTLVEYFDPSSGRLPDRLRRLTDEDGELASLLRRAVGNDNSELARTLTAHVGAGSALFRLLDPASSDGLVAGLGTLVADQLAHQRDAVLRQFSLDDKSSALSRLVIELEQRHGKLEVAVDGKIGQLIREFSADEDGSALNRLTTRVERAQKTITDEFSLDNDGSALNRFRREITSVIAAQQQAADKFHHEITQMVSQLVGKREAEARSTLHGHTFEDLLAAEIHRRAAEQGHVAETTGATVGRKRHCKKGDVVVHLGPDHPAADARIVFEAKQDASYSLKAARDEIAEARDNRDAGIGVFVFSSRTAPDTLRPFHRIGDDLFVVWNPEDPATDVVLDAALAASAALSAARSHADEDIERDLDAVDRALLDLAKRIENLGEVHKLASTIKGNSEKILKRVDLDRAALESHLHTLRASAAGVRAALTD